MTTFLNVATKTLITTGQTILQTVVKENFLQEPYFKIDIFLALKDGSQLEYFEDILYKQGHAILK